VMAPAIEAELDKLVTPLPAPVARPNQGV
jgi:hypothetical protein